MVIHYSTLKIEIRYYYRSAQQGICYSFNWLSTATFSLEPTAWPGIIWNVSWSSYKMPQWTLKLQSSFSLDGKLFSQIITRWLQYIQVDSHLIASLHGKQGSEEWGRYYILMHTSYSTWNNQLNLFNVRLESLEATLSQASCRAWCVHTKDAALAENRRLPLKEQTSQLHDLGSNNVQKT